jgi:hypothetical protein
MVKTGGVTQVFDPLHAFGHFPFLGDELKQAVLLAKGPIYRVLAAQPSTAATKPGDYSASEAAAAAAQRRRKDELQQAVLPAKDPIYRVLAAQPSTTATKPGD